MHEKSCSKKIVVIGGFAESLVNFKGPLLGELTAQGHEVYGCAPAASQPTRAALAALGARYVDIPFSRTGLNPFRDLGSLFSLCGILRKIRPDVVISYTIKPVIYGSLAANLAGIPGIFSMIEGVGYVFASKGWKSGLIRILASWLYRLSLACNTKVFFLNPDDLAFFKGRGLLRRKQATLLLNGAGVDVEHFKVVKLPTKPSFLLMARLLRDKGIREYVAAAKILRSKYPESTFSLAGWLDENPECVTKDELQAWIDEGSVIFLGRLDDVRPALTDCSVYVLPSYHEGMPRTVLEAMAMGRPIVTTDAPGCRETVIQGENGFLVPVKDACALAEAMERFILKPGLIAEMGRRSRKIAEERFDVRRVNAVIMRHMELMDHEENR